MSDLVLPVDLPAGHGEGCGCEERLSQSRHDPDEDGQAEEEISILHQSQEAEAGVAQTHEDGPDDDGAPRAEDLDILCRLSSQYSRLSLYANICLAKYRCEDERGDEDGAEDDPGLGDRHSLAQSLGGVEGSDEGEGDSSDEHSPADEEQVGHCLASHWEVLILFTKLKNI